MPTRTEYNREALTIMHEMIEEIKSLESQEFLYLSQKWQIVERKLEDNLAKLAELEIKSQAQLFREEKYLEFLDQSKFLVEKYQHMATKVILDNMETTTRLGSDTAYKIIDRFGINFYRMFPDKVNEMIGLTKQDAPLYNLLIKSYPKTIDKIADILVRNQALGKNPRATALELSKVMNANKTRSLLVARTEQLRVNREASILSIKESGVCKGWIRIETLDDLTCDECEEANGKEYGFDENTIDFHPNCRGAVCPNVG